MKTHKIIYQISAILVLVSTLGLAACSAAATAVIEDPVEVEAPAAQAGTTEISADADEPVDLSTDLIIVDEEGNTSIDNEVLETTISIAAESGLTEAEAEGLVFMREEEKLARDVYLTLYGQWNIPIFQNIAGSEQTHTDAVKTLLDNYNLVDPVVNDEIGVFTNPDLQSLYDQLVGQGSQSLSDALQVGAVIEEIDILDLEKYIAQTDNTDIQLVYENLMKGSRNHLRSFVSTIQKQTGGAYQPQYLSQAVFDAIVGTGIEMGGNGQGKGNNGN